MTTNPVVVRSMPWNPSHPSREVLLNREWLVTNGLGGYASGTVSGAITRKYHGLLVAALPAPLGRVVMWSHVSEFLHFEGDEVVSLGAEERAGGQLDLKSAECLSEFRLEDGMPVWVYQVRNFVIEKRVSMPHLQNTVHISYQISGEGRPPRLELRPAFHFRHHEDAVDVPLAEPYRLTAIGDR
ncbi:MAG TPA: glycogen debranching enzyme N-terminal domain-containing protein, partial [Chthoniobacterales bacterium]|nr:glycogen debranching enzyme N-terminal domain-containing protein [Chthoniobacterales bacterium]